MTTENSNKVLNELTHGKLIAKNTVFNIIFQVLPLFLAVITIPVLIKGLGTDKYGVLSLAWIVMGYFGLFDMGISRALIKLVGERLAENKMDEIPSVFWTGIGMMTAFGLVITVLVVSFANTLVYHTIKIPDVFRGESLLAFVVIGLSVPIVITSAALWGVMEARQKFLHVNIVRTINSVFTLVIPVVCLHFTKNIGYIVIALIIGRIVLWFLSFHLCQSVLPVLKTNRHFNRKEVGPLLNLGGWMTVSNLLSPMMVYFDRFFIGALISVSAVAYYSTPYDVVSKLLVISTALNRVLFPAFSAGHKTLPQKTSRMYEWGRLSMMAVFFPISLTIVVFANKILLIWVGPEFALKSTFIMQCLAIGIFFNATAQVSFGLIQASGRPDITARLHIFELPVYIALFWFLTRKWELDGAAIAWTVRVLFDTAALLFYSYKLLTVKYRQILEIGLFGSLLLLLVPLIIHNFIFNVFYYFIILIIFAISLWTWFLLPEERTMVQTRTPFIKRYFVKE